MSEIRENVLIWKIGTKQHILAHFYFIIFTPILSATHDGEVVFRIHNFPNFGECSYLHRTPWARLQQEVRNWTVSYFHDESHNAVVNLTMKVFSTITKLLLYFEVKMAEDRNDNEYRRQFIKTVIDVEKCFKGMQSSIFLKAYVEELNRYMNFNLTFPLAPVSRKAASRTVFLNWCVVRDGRCFS